MAYELDNPIADCRSALSAGQSKEALEKVCHAMRKILQNPDFVEQHFGTHLEIGRSTLYHDPDLDFYVYAHIPDGAILSPPHDHASAWAAYGQAVDNTQMTDWVIPAGEELPKPVKTYSMTPGTAGFYDVGELHSIDMPATSRFLRITATDIDVLPCKYYDAVDTRKSIAENLA